MKKETKKRWDLRVPPELDERVQHIAGQIGITRTALIESAVWSFLLDSRKFAKCPSCGQHLFIKEDVQISEGVNDFTCSKGHRHIYDFEKGEFIK